MFKSGTLNPDNSVKLKKDDKELGVTQQRMGDTLTFTIENTQFTDLGVYTCTDSETEQTASYTLKSDDIEGEFSIINTYT